MAYIRFAIVVGNEVAGTATFDDEHPADSVPRLIAAYRSDPKIVETSDPDVGFGWTFDGTEFHPPVTE